jgi:NADH-quinone oxidoreductase subunit J
MNLTPILFYILAIATSICAVAVVVTQNIVRAAAWLLFALGGTAAIFFLLGADFVGSTQLLVYVGGTLVLVVFGVMLTAQGPFINMKIGAAEWLIALCAGLLLYGVLAVTLWKFPSPAPASTVTQGDHPAQLASSVVLGQAFLGLKEATPTASLTGLPPGAKPLPRTPMAYLLIFEIVSVHLLVVLIGAAYLARAKRRRGVVS